MTETGRIPARALLATVGQDHIPPGRDPGLRHEDKELPPDPVVVIEVAMVVEVWLPTIVVAIVHLGVKDYGGVLATVVIAVGREVQVEAEIEVVIGDGSH